jgi:hypothetical protein
MLKKLIQVSSLAGMLAMAALLPAAASEEDLAAPAGSFTSDMAIPARPGHVSWQAHAFFLGRHHAWMEGRFGNHFG